MKLLFSNTILEKILELKEEGYDRINTPGGTSKDGNDYSGIIGYHWSTIFNKFYFVGVPYNSTFYKTQQKNDDRKAANETPIDTACREFFEETGKKIDNPGDLIYLYSKDVPDKRPEMQGKMHRKHFYMINIDKCSGELHTFEGANPIDGETAAPILMPVDLFQKVLFGGHQDAYKKACEKLSEDREIAFQLMNYIK